MDQRGVMDTVSVADAIAWQADHAARNGAPGTARIIRAMLALEDGSSVTARRILGWEGLSLRDAMPLRIAGGLHHLMLTGDAPQLERVYDGQLTDQADIDVLVGDLVKRFDARLLPWLGSPPQTNEAGRSASFMAALLWLADGRTTARFSLLEIGAIAGINTMMGRYRYRLGKTVVGPVQSAMHIAPEWRGASPPASAPCIADARGCDIAPVDLSDPDQALRLKAYISRTHGANGRRHRAGPRNPAPDRQGERRFLARNHVSAAAAARHYPRGHALDHVAIHGGCRTGPVCRRHRGSRGQSGSG